MKSVLFLLFVTCVLGVSGLAAQAKNYETDFFTYPIRILIDDKVVMFASDMKSFEQPRVVAPSNSPLYGTEPMPGIPRFSTVTFTGALSVTPEFIEWVGKYDKKTIKVCIAQENPRENVYFLLPNAFVSNATIDGTSSPVPGLVQWASLIIASDRVTITTGNLTETTTPTTTPPTMVTTQPTASTALFIAGKTLRWQTNANGSQKGSAVVTSTKGNYFYLDQTNQKNTAAGVTKLEGEFKDGKVYIYNKKWNETWIGTLNNGVVTGKINRSIDFKIFE